MDETPVSPSVLAEDLRALADVGPFDLRWVRMLDQAADALDEVERLHARVTELASALERLVCRVERDCNLDASESAGPADEHWARVVDELAGMADECGKVLLNEDVDAAVGELSRLRALPEAIAAYVRAEDMGDLRAKRAARDLLAELMDGPR